jgi:hypothetical protein
MLGISRQPKRHNRGPAAARPVLVCRTRRSETPVQTYWLSADGVSAKPSSGRKISLRRSYMNAAGRVKADPNVERVVGLCSDLYCFHFGLRRSAWPAHITPLPCDRENVFARREMQYDSLGCAQKGNRLPVDSYLKITCWVLRSGVPRDRDNPAAGRSLKVARNEDSLRRRGVRVRRTSDGVRCCTTADHQHPGHPNDVQAGHRWNGNIRTHTHVLK